MHVANAIIANQKKIGAIVSIASLVLIGISLYSLNLQIKHTKLQLSKFDSEKK